MTTWRYKAISDAGVVSGERAGESAAEVRSALHAVGLRVLDLKPLRTRRGPSEAGSAAAGLHRFLDRRLRARRGAIKAEFLDGLATMLEAGVPLVEAVGSMGEDRGDQSSADNRTARLLRDLATDLQGGRSLGDAMRGHPSWFDAAESAMVDAGQKSGELPGVIRTIAERHTRSGELANRLAAALAYPTIVALVGVGVVIFLSTKTLPELASVLEESDQPVPALTAGVMAVGQGLLAALPWLLAGCLLVLPLALLTAMIGSRLGLKLPRWPSPLTPRVLRRAAVAEFFLGFSELLRTGVPAVESLRVMAPTAGGLLTGRLGTLISRAADRLEHGEPIEDALSDPEWFPGEVERLIRIGQHSGELDKVLERLGQRYRRSARRLIDRLAALLEPAVVLVLAVGVGMVVMAAILPLVRLQEML